MWVRNPPIRNSAELSKGNSSRSFDGKYAGSSPASATNFKIMEVIWNDLIEWLSIADINYKWEVEFVWQNTIGKSLDKSS